MLESQHLTESHRTVDVHVAAGDIETARITLEVKDTRQTADSRRTLGEGNTREEIEPGFLGPRGRTPREGGGSGWGLSYRILNQFGGGTGLYHTSRSDSRLHACRVFCQ
jgi:signal transduction histidine kinase